MKLSIGEAMESFWRRVRKTDDCWIWTGNRGGSSGYGIFSYNKKRVVAHRFSYESLVGPIPVGLSIDHLCKNPPCVRPEHLEPVTQKENVLRGIGPTAENSRKVSCPLGHKYINDLDWKGKPRRQCRVCKNQKRRKVAS